MALFLLHLGLPLSPQPAPYLALPKTPARWTIPHISFSNARTLRWRASLPSCLRFSFIAAASSSATAEPAVEEDSVEGSSVPRTRLIAQNVPWTCTSEDIKNLFEKHGTVIDVELSMYNKSRNRGLAFITMASEEEALTALTNLNSYDLDGRVIRVEFARSLKKNPSGTAAPVQGYSVFVGNLSWRVRSRDLREFFSPNENVLSADVIFQTNPRRPAGYGFVTFSSKEEAEAAIVTFNEKSLMGRPVRLVMKENPTDGSDGKPYVDEKLNEASSVVDGTEDTLKPGVET